MNSEDLWRDLWRASVFTMNRPPFTRSQLLSRQPLPAAQCSLHDLPSCNNNDRIPAKRLSRSRRKLFFRKTPATDNDSTIDSASTDSGSLHVRRLGVASRRQLVFNPQENLERVQSDRYLGPIDVDEVDPSTSRSADVETKVVETQHGPTAPTTTKLAGEMKEFLEKIEDQAKELDPSAQRRWVQKMNVEIASGPVDVDDYIVPKSSPTTKSSSSDDPSLSSLDEILGGRDFFITEDEDWQGLVGYERGFEPERITHYSADDVRRWETDAAQEADLDFLMNDWDLESARDQSRANTIAAHGLRPPHLKTHRRVRSVPSSAAEV